VSRLDERPVDLIGGCSTQYTGH